MCCVVGIISCLPVPSRRLIGRNILARQHQPANAFTELAVELVDRHPHVQDEGRQKRLSVDNLVVCASCSECVKCFTVY